jgi:hypothetical protein
MTDFLANLVDRSLERSPVLERRRPTLFEPGRASTRLDGPVSNADSLMEEVSESTSRQASTEVQSQSPSPFSEPSDPKHSEAPMGRRETTLIEIHAAEVPLREKEVSRAPLTPRLDQRESFERPSPSLSSRTRTNADEQITERQRLIETIVERRVERQESPESSIRSSRNEAEPGLIPPTSLTQIPEVKAADTAGRTDTVARQPEPRIEFKPSRKSAPTREIGPVIRAAPRPQPSMPKSEAHAPTINVTIGRIEVRATPAPATSKTTGTRPAATKLSLDDYLLSRNEGRK